LDSDDKTKTAEGYPAPLRATLIAEAWLMLALAHTE
jgi:hypothetical protein